MTSLKAKNTRIAGKCDYIQKEHQSTSFKDLREMKIKKKNTTTFTWRWTWEMSTDHQACTSGKNRRKQQNLLDRNIACYFTIRSCNFPNYLAIFAPIRILLSSGENPIGVDTDTVRSLMTPQTIMSYPIVNL